MKIRNRIKELEDEIQEMADLYSTYKDKLKWEHEIAKKRYLKVELIDILFGK